VITAAVGTVATATWGWRNAAVEPEPGRLACRVVIVSIPQRERAPEADPVRGRLTLEERIRDKGGGCSYERQNDPDGCIVTMDNGDVVLDRGAKDGLLVGTRFEVFTPGPEDFRRIKGTIEVFQVGGGHWALARGLAKDEHSRDFAAGDFVSNPYFNTRHPVHVCMPRGLRLRRIEDVSVALARAGIVVDAEIDVHTDIAVYPEEERTEQDRAKDREPARMFGAAIEIEKRMEEFLGL
jgi:hypothetical protein